MKNYFTIPLTLVAAFFLIAAPVTLQAQDETIAADDSLLTRFADGVVDFSPATSTLSADVSDPTAALGAPNIGNTGDPDFNPIGLVSLGDPLPGESAGAITLSFSTPVNNSLGERLAVFENAFDFGSRFAELAFVEVSSDGQTFARFENFSAVTPLGSVPANPATDLLPDFSGNLDFATLPSRDLVSGFAGADLSSVGTIFDLSDLENDSLVLDGSVDLDNIGFIRLVDVPGDGRETDSFGNPIFDAFSPNNPLGGFDLDAVGVVSAAAVPEPSSVALLGLASAVVIGRRRRRN